MYYAWRRIQNSIFWKIIAVHGIELVVHLPYIE